MKFKENCKKSIMGGCQECCHNRCGYTSVECVCCGEDVYICSEEEKTYEDCGDDFTCCDCAKDFMYCEDCRQRRESSDLHIARLVTNAKLKLEDCEANMKKAVTEADKLIALALYNTAKEEYNEINTNI